MPATMVIKMLRFMVCSSLLYDRSKMVARTQATAPLSALTLVSGAATASAFMRSREWPARCGAPLSIGRDGGNPERGDRILFGSVVAPRERFGVALLLPPCRFALGAGAQMLLLQTLIRIADLDAKFAPEGVGLIAHMELLTCGVVRDGLHSPAPVFTAHGVSLRGLRLPL